LQLVLHKVALVRAMQNIACRRSRRYWMRNRLDTEHFTCYSLEMMLQHLQLGNQNR